MEFIYYWGAVAYILIGVAIAWMACYNHYTSITERLLDLDACRVPAKFKSRRRTKILTVIVMTVFLGIGWPIIVPWCWFSA